MSSTLTPGVAPANVSMEATAAAEGGFHEGGSEGATSGHEFDDALDRRVHRVLRVGPVLGRACCPVCA